MPIISVPITWTDPVAELRSRAIAERFGLPMVTPDASRDLSLVMTDTRLELHGGGMSIACDFLTGPLGHRIRSGAHNVFRGEALVKAMSDKAATVIDATAGLGRDSVLLALAGFHVMAVERHPAIAALLDDGLSRARADETFAAQIGDRLTLRCGDAVALLPSLPRVDVVYLDPMFPQRTKSAAVKKEMQLLQQLHDADAAAGDEMRLLDAAIAHACRRVVVKRPIKAPALAGREPDFQRADKTIRYDIYQPSCSA